ncbi:antA/AntB antirepressor family protein [Billgrantia sp. C5P2]|uniref:antA/AntB antirepressor family protein n=1 Tax=Billgrantia sp. C5P2 TaxID=3436239 RepID=UPI003DA292D3
MDRGTIGSSSGRRRSPQPWSVASSRSHYGFAEGQDFCSELSKTPNGGRPSKEYHLSLDMAKELSMVERNEKGKQARQLS